MQIAKWTTILSIGFILSFATAILGYREYERQVWGFTPDEIQDYLKEEFGKQLGHVEEVHRHAHGQAQVNVQNIATLYTRDEILKSRIDDLILRLSEALPNGAYLTAPVKPFQIEQILPFSIPEAIQRQGDSHTEEEQPETPPSPQIPPQESSELPGVIIEGVPPVVPEEDTPPLPPQD